MKLKKGNILHFTGSDRKETIEKASNNRISGEVKTNHQTYSTDFIYRWIEFGFVKILLV